MIPLWLALPLSALLVIGGTLALIGALGLFRLPSFYQRMHAPSLITSWGTGAIILASMGYFSWLDGRPVLHELIIGVFVMITTPVTMLLLGRAAVQRDSAQSLSELAAPPKPKD
jgi:multicomponent K+:H+ antiporter subunit G